MFRKSLSKIDRRADAKIVAAVVREGGLGKTELQNKDTVEKAAVRIRALIERCTASGEREDIPVRVTATVPSKFGVEPVAEFVLSLSIKVKSV